MNWPTVLNKFTPLWLFSGFENWLICPVFVFIILALGVINLSTYITCDLENFSWSFESHSLREKCPHLEFLWSVFNLNAGKIWNRKTPNTDTFHAMGIASTKFNSFMHNNSEYSNIHDKMIFEQYRERI